MPSPSDIRKLKILRAVVREYFESAEPVGSETIVAKYRLNVSPATIRNDMAELEKDGLLEQPHTSAGRIPTEKGYRLYVRTFVGHTELTPKERVHIEAALAMRKDQNDDAAKGFARAVAALSEETVFVRIGSNLTYLTGVANLLRKPEFHEDELLSSVSKLVDDLDEALEDATRRIRDDIQVFIGSDNPFGSALSTVLTRYEAPRLGGGVIGIVGPKRMDYDANVALIRYIHEIFTEEE